MLQNFDSINADLWWTKPFDPTISLRSRINEIGRTYPDQPAVLIGPDDWITFGQLHARAQAHASAISRAAQSHPGPAVCLVSTNASLYIGLIAMINSGLDFSMLDPASPPLRNKLAAESIGARIVIVDQKTAHLADAVVGDDSTVINIDEQHSIEQSTETGTPSDRDSKMFIFTSGSTGTPKGVIRSLSSMHHTQYNMSKRFGYRPTDTMLYTGSPGHVGTLNDALSALLNGHRTIAVDLEHLDIGAIWNSFLRYEVTITSLPPSIMRICLQYGAGHAPASSIRCAAVSGEPLLRSDVDLFYRVFDPAVRFWQSYGSTECGQMSAGIYSPTDAQGTGSLPLTLHTDGVEIEIVTDAGSLAEFGQEGTVRVRSLSLAEGYTATSEMAKSEFGEDDRGRFFLTGDRAKLLDDQSMVIVGRADRQVNIHGKRLELTEVESAILSLDKWNEASVVLVENTHGAKRISAMISPADDANPDLSTLRDNLLKRLPASALPRVVIVCDRLPRTTTGKVDLMAVKHQLEQRANSTQIELSAHAQPADGPTENWIADAWQEVMHCPHRPSRSITFDDYGGDSLDVIQLCLTLGQQFGIEVGIDFITAHPTIAQQAEALQTGLASSHQRFVSLKEHVDGPLIVLFPGLGGHAWVFRALARELQPNPCTLISANYMRNNRSSENEMHPRQFAQELVAYVHAHELTNREIIFTGYSLGSIVCAKVYQELMRLNPDFHVSGFVLLDPSPLAKESKKEILVGSVKQRLRSLRQRNEDTDMPTNQSARLLDQEVLETAEILKNYYQPHTTTLAQLPCRILLTKHGLDEKGAAKTIYGRSDTETGLTAYADLDHLDILRDKGVKRCASWLWQQVMALSAHPDADSLILPDEPDTMSA